MGRKIFRATTKICFIVLTVASLNVHTAQAQNTGAATGAFSQVGSKLMGQGSSGNELVKGTLQYDAAEKARERLLEAAEKEGGGSKPPGGTPLLQMPRPPLIPGGNTIKIPTK